ATGKLRADDLEAATAEVGSLPVPDASKTLEPWIFQDVPDPEEEDRLMTERELGYEKPSLIERMGRKSKTISEAFRLRHGHHSSERPPSGSHPGHSPVGVGGHEDHSTAGHAADGVEPSTPSQPISPSQPSSGVDGSQFDHRISAASNAPALLHPNSQVAQDAQERHTDEDEEMFLHESGNGEYPPAPKTSASFSSAASELNVDAMVAIKTPATSALQRRGRFIRNRLQRDGDGGGLNRRRTLPSNPAFVSPAFRSVPRWLRIRGRTLAVALIVATSVLSVANLLIGIVTLVVPSDSATCDASSSSSTTTVAAAAVSATATVVASSGVASNPFTQMIAHGNFDVSATNGGGGQSAAATETVAATTTTTTAAGGSPLATTTVTTAAAGEPPASPAQPTTSPAAAEPAATEAITVDATATVGGDGGSGGGGGGIGVTVAVPGVTTLATTVQVPAAAAAAVATATATATSPGGVLSVVLEQAWGAVASAVAALGLD
ncbi:hypothetical protein HK405_008031, partial [Cladochytrium tenue]